MRLDGDVRIHLAEPVDRRCELGAPDVAGAVQELAVQVGDVDAIEVDDAQRADARCGEVERGG